MGAADILALIQVAVMIVEQLTYYITKLKAHAADLGATPEDVAAAEARGHEAARKLTEKADAILNRLGNIDGD